MILLISNSQDLAVDSVVRNLRARDVGFCRLDLDLLKEDRIQLEPTEPALLYSMDGREKQEIRQPRSILFRAPTHLRESSGHRYSPENLLQRHQWAAFARSLMVFDRAKWINHPVATYAAENKPFQILKAAELGFEIPDTAIANHLPPQFSDRQQVVVKSLDAFLLRQDDADLFFYTNAIPPEEATWDACKDMPLIFQTYIEPKVDIRVTVIGDRCFVAEAENSISGDWRLHKSNIKFRPAPQSEEFRSSCVALLRSLNLRYGAIDFVRVSSRYYFLEINPTGEWGWLDDTFSGEISAAIADELIND